VEIVGFLLCQIILLSRKNRLPFMLELYQFESCPYCAKVRAKLTELEIDYIARSAPPGSKQRETLQELGGQQQVPFLVDPEMGESLYESDDIIAYLEEHYSNK